MKCVQPLIERMPGIPCIMVLIQDGSLEHVAHACSKIGLFRKKSDLMTLSIGQIEIPDIYAHHFLSYHLILVPCPVNSSVKRFPGRQQIDVNIFTTKCLRSLVHFYVAAHFMKMKILPGHTEY